MPTQVRSSGSKALRRDIAILSVAAAASISLGGWIHSHTCELEAEPTVVVRAVDAADVAAPAPEVVASRVAAPLEYGEHFAYVIDLEEPYIVLATDVDASWEGEFDQLAGIDTVFRDVDVPALPQSIQDMRGREVTLWSSELGGVPVALGRARIGEPRIVAQASGSLGSAPELDSWALYEQFERDGVLPAPLEKRVSAALWEDGLRLLVAPLEGSRASEATWARSADLPAPVFFQPRALDRPEAVRMEDAFTLADEGRNADSEHILRGHGSVMSHLRHRGWVDTDGRLRAATTFIDSPHVDICGGFDAVYSLGAQVDGSAWGKPSTIPTNHTMGPVMVGDLNDDGFADMILEPTLLDGNTTLLRGTPAGFSVEAMLGEVPYFGCRC
jgi:hypothetical protein